MNEDTTAERIHEASLSLLEDPGVRVEHEAVTDLLLANGAKKGASEGAVIFPRELVADCLEQCPPEVTFTNRSGAETTISAESDPVIWACPGTSLYRDGRHRAFTSADMADMARLLDQLDNVHAVFGMSMDDVPAAARDVVGLKIMAQNTSKHIRALCFTPAGVETMVEMQNVVGAHPWFSVGFTAHGPLRWTNLALSIFESSAGHGIPTTVNGEPMAGVSGPVTLAGSAAVGNAEILSGIVINQLLEPGRPCVYNLGLAHIFDMKTAIAVTGAPENALFAKLSAIMGRFYGLPSGSWVSTEAMCPDAQAALEKMFGFQTHMAAGVNNIWGLSQLESELTVSTAQAVIDNEMVSYCKRYQRGVDVSDESLALDVVRSVGIAGSFIEEMHTFEHFRSELFMPELLFRQKRQAWNDAGRKRLDQAAEEVATQLIANEVDNGLTDEQSRALDEIADRFLSDLAK